MQKQDAGRGLPHQKLGEEGQRLCGELDPALHLEPAGTGRLAGKPGLLPHGQTRLRPEPAPSEAPNLAVGAKRAFSALQASSQLLLLLLQAPSFSRARKSRF